MVPPSISENTPRLMAGAFIHRCGVQALNPIYRSRRTHRHVGPLLPLHGLSRRVHSLVLLERPDLPTSDGVAPESLWIPDDVSKDQQHHCETPPPG